jgi:hypothetical protein
MLEQPSDMIAAELQQHIKDVELLMAAAYMKLVRTGCPLARKDYEGWRTYLDEMEALHGR